MKAFIKKMLELIKSAWQFIVVISVIFGFYAYFHEKKADVQFEIIADPNVFDVYKSVNDLAIYFQGKDIEKENLNLKVYDIRIENSGESDILKNFYDDSLPWGFSIDNGEIVSDPRTIKSNSEYLDLNLKPKIKENKIEFEKVIFEHGKYFIVEFLILHKKNEIPKLIPFGKIAGIDSFDVIRNADQEKRSFLNQLTNGGIAIHLIRLFAYTSISVLLLLAYVFISDRIEKMKEKRKENRRAEIFQEYLNKNPILIPEVALFLNDLYSKGNLHALIRFRKKMKNERSLLYELEKSMEMKRIYPESVNSFHSLGQNFMFGNYYNEELLNSLVKRENDIQIIEPSLKAELNKLIPYLNKVNFKFGK